MSNSLATFTGKNLVTNGSFEQGSYGWFNAAPQYAAAPQQGVEVNSAAACTYGVSGLSGSSAMEIDFAGAADKISQTIQTSAGKSYLFSFDAAMRACTAAASNAFDVYWTSGGVRTKLGTVTPTTTAMANYSFLVDARYVTGNSTISFEETGGNGSTSDGVGGIVDNVAVREVMSSVAPAFSLSEVAGATGGTTLLSAVAEFGISDQDRADTHTIKSVALTAPSSVPAASLAALQGALTASLSETRSAAASQSAAGQVTLAFSVQDRFIDFLGEGQTLKLTYNVAIQDSQGGIVVQPVVVTLTGKNDAPVIQTGPVSASLVEAVGQTGSTTPDATTAVLAFTDADLTDTHVATATLKSVAAGGGVSVPQASLDAFASAFLNNLTVTEPNGGAAGKVTANFSVADRNFDFLAAGQTVSLVYEIGVNDGNGGIAKQLVTVTVTGTNDAPTVTAAAGVAVTEDVTSTATGTIAFTDADLSDGHTASFVKNAATTTSYGIFSLGGVNEAANAADGTVGYTYTVDNSKIQFLGRNDSVQEKFDVTIADGKGGTVTKTVAVTIAGTNDAPVLVLDANLVRNGSFEEGAVGYPVSAPGWTGSNGHVEIGIPAWYGVSGATGAQVLEIDAFAANDAGGGAPDQISQTIATSAGQPYRFSFDAAMRAGTSPDTNQFEVYWNGARIATIRPTDTAFKTYTFDVQATGASSTIAFKEVAGPNNVYNDSYGGLIDNVSVRLPSVNLVQNGSFEANGTGLTVSAPGWTGANGYLEVGNISSYGVIGATGSQVLEVDSVSYNYNGNTAPDQISQTLATVAGQTYTFAFDTAMRAGTSPDTNQFEVYWNGTKIATIRPTDTAFKTYTFDVQATGASSTIAFKEVVGPNNVYNDSYGGLIDNVSVIAKPALAASAFTEKAGVTGDGAAADAATTSFALSFDDADASDTHTGKVTVSAVSTTAPGGVPQATLAALPAAFAFTAIEPTATSPGTLNANFSLLDSYLDFLGAGQTLTVTFQVAVDDGAATSAVVAKTITFTGTNDAPIVSGAVAGVATEDGAKATLNALANASDVDAGTVLVVTGVPATLPAGVTYDAAAKTFTLDPANAAYQALAAGERTTVSVAYGVSDGIATTPASVSWTVTGTNDAPVVSGAVTGTATEDGAKSTLNALANASDVDRGTVLQVTGVPSGLPAGVSYDAATRTFTLDPSNAAYQSLAAGEKATVSVAYAVSDGIATTPASVSWVVTGVNDKPTITSAAQVGGVTEDGTSVANGTVAFADVDLSDGHTASVSSKAGQTALGSFALAPVREAANAASGSVGWSYTLDPSKAQFLAAGETRTEVYTITVDDGHGGTVSQDVTVTITGTNDDAVISAAPGKPDLIVGNVNGVAGAQVSLGNGDGTFAAGQSVNTGGDSHYGVVVADVNGDGRPDLIVMNRNGSAGAQVSLGNGDGTFQTGQAVLTGDNTHGGVTVADVNGDGKLDLIVTNLSGVTGAQVSLGRGDGTFAPGQSVTTGGDVHVGVVVADVNGDGKLDLIVSNLKGSGAQVSLGKGDGTFQNGYAVDTGGDDHFAVATADVNGDGKLDLVVTNYAGDFGAQVSLGKGDGTFQAGKAVNTGGDEHFAVVMADVNGDGKLDLIVTNALGANGAQVSLGNGDGTFQAGKAVNTGGDSHGSVAVADVNGDGKLDLIVSNFNGDGAQVSLGKGDGTFETGYAIATGGSQHDVNALVVADVNTPSDRGFITEGGASSVSDKLVFSDVDLKDVHRASASYTGTVPALGVLTARVTRDTTGTGKGGEITWTYDVDPAKIDALAQGETVVETYDVALNDGTSTVRKAVTITLTGTNDAPVVTGVVTGTTTEDGAKATLNALGNASDVDHGAVLSVVLPANLPAGVTYDATARTFTLDPANAAYRSLAAGEKTTVTVAYGVSDGIATTPASVSWTVTGTNDAPVASGAVTGTATEDGAASTLNALANASDVDHGAVLSVVVDPSKLPPGVTYDAAAKTFTLDPSNAAYRSLAAGETTTVTVAYGVSDGIATTRASVAWTVTGTNDDAVISAVPSRPDIVLSNRNGGNGAQVSLGNGDGTFQAGQAVNTGGTMREGVALADVNGDGRLDLVVTNENDGTGVQVSLGNGDGTFQAGYGVNTGNNAYESGFQAVTAADLNGDGKLDLILTNRDGGNDPRVVLGNGDGTFKDGQALNMGGNPRYNVVVADVNNDHRPDLIFANPYGDGAQVVLGNGDGTFQVGQAAVHTGGDNHTAVALADVNGDGKLDLVVTNYYGGDGVQVSLGNGDGTFQDGQAVHTGGDGHSAVVLADANGDGKLDLIVTNDSGGGGAQVSLGNGDGTFQAGQAVNTGGDGHSAIAVADVNGDDKLDIIVTNGAGDAGVQVSFGNGDGTFQAGRAVNTGGYGHSYNSLVVADVDTPSDRGFITEGGASSVSDKLLFSDVDLKDVHQASASYTGTVPALGALTASVTRDTTGTGKGGEITWTYTVDPMKIDALAAGEKVVETYDVALNDGTSTVHKAVTITLTGTNDAPVVSGAVTGTATEDGAASTLNALANASDVDHGTVLSVVLPSTLPAGVSYDAATKTFTLDPADTAYQSLAADQTTIVSVSYGVSDGKAITPSTASWTVTGTNDKAAISVADRNNPGDRGALIENAANSVSDKLVFTDIDLADRHTVTTQYTGNGSAIGVLTARVTNDTTGTGTGGEITWVYTPDPAKIDALRDGERTTETFDVALNDGTSTVFRSVTVTLTGTNDNAVISVADRDAPGDRGSLTEDEASFISDRLVFTDVDLGDRHTVTTRYTGGGSAIGSLTASVSKDTTRTGTGGEITWVYTPDPTKIDALAQDQKKIETFDVLLNDGQSTVVRSVTIELTGTDDLPQLSVAIQTGSVGAAPAAAAVPVSAVSPTFAALEFDSNFGTMSGVQTIDRSLLRITPSDTSRADPNDPAITITGDIAPSSTFFDGQPDKEYFKIHLNAGETITLDVDGTSVNGRPGLDSQVRILGAGGAEAARNDNSFDDGDGSNNGFDPFLRYTAPTSGDYIVELGASALQTFLPRTGAYQMQLSIHTPVPPSTASGSFGFTDADLIDRHAVTPRYVGSDEVGALTARVTNDTTGTGTGGVVDWTYTLDKEKVKSLAEGETRQEVYELRLLDGSTFVSKFVTITVTGTNDAPVVTGAVTGTGTNASDAMVTLNALANASDPDRGTVLSVVDIPSDIASKGISYDAATKSFTLDVSKNTAFQSLGRGQTAGVTISYGVSDGTATTEASMTWTITGVEHPAVFGGRKTGSVTEDSTLTASGTLTVTDPDPGDATFQVAYPGNRYGTFTFSTQSGDWTYTLNNSNAAVQALGVGQTLHDTMDVYAKDGTTQTIDVTINGTNDTPVAKLDYGIVLEAGVSPDNTPTPSKPVASGNVLSNDTDIDGGDTKTVTTTGTFVGTYGTLVLDANGSFTYTLDNNDPDTNAIRQGGAANDVFSYTMKDSAGATASSTLTIFINGANDAPVVTGAVTGTATEGGAKATLNALANASDVDRGTVLSVVLPSTLPAGVSYDADTKTFTLDPANAAYQSLAAGEKTTVSVSYGVSDGTVTTPASASWAVTGTNDNAVISVADRNNPGDRGSLTEDQASFVSDKLVFTDADLADTHTVTTRYTGSGSALGTLTASVTNDTTGTGTGGEITWVYTPDPTKIDALKDGERKVETFDVALNDGTSTVVRGVTITLTGTNDAPVVSGPVNGVMSRNGGPVTLSALANASDADRGTVLSVVLPSKLPDGVTYDATTKSFTIDPTAANLQTLFDHGPGSAVAIPYGVSDGIATTNAWVSWTVGTDADSGSPATLAGTFSQMNASFDFLKNAGTSMGNAGAALLGEVTSGAAAAQSKINELIGAGTAGGASALVDFAGVLKPLVATLVNQVNTGAAGVFSTIGKVNDAVAAALEEFNTLQRQDFIEKSSAIFDQVNANLRRISSNFPGLTSAVSNISGSVAASQALIAKAGREGTLDAAELAKFNADLLNLNAGLDKVKGSGILGGANLVAVSGQIADLNKAFADLAGPGFERSEAHTDIKRKKAAASTDIDKLNAIIDDGVKAGTVDSRTAVKTKAALSDIESGFGALTGDKPADGAAVSDTNATMAAQLDALTGKSGSPTPVDPATISDTLDALADEYKSKVIGGTDGNDVLRGGNGNDTIVGLGGNDLLYGGAGSNIFVFTPGAGQDRIADFGVQGASHDVLDIRAYHFASLADVIAATVTFAGDSTIALNATDRVTLTGVTKSDLQAHPEDFRLA